MERMITEEWMEKYENYLYEEEKSKATIEKYIRDVKKLMDYAAGREITKPLMIDFKEKLFHKDHYKVSSVNSFLEAVNRFLEYMGWHDSKVKSYRVQKESYCTEERHLSKEEYKRLLNEAKRQNKKRIYIMMEVMASTGMRVSELIRITAEGVRSGIVETENKGKIRKVLLTKGMQKQLLQYIKEEKISSGIIFRTKKGKPMNRSNIWKEMKGLCQGARVDAAKTFPHNLRKLFAGCLYKLKHDIVKVADLLGHSNMETTRRYYVRETSMEQRKTLEMLHLVGEKW